MRRLEHLTLKSYQSSPVRSEFWSKPLAWFASVAVFRLALDYTYVFWVVGSGIYGDGFDYGFNWLRQIESGVALILLSALISPHCRRTSDFLTLVLFALCAVPITSYYAWTGGARIWFWALVVQFLIFRGVVLYLKNIALATFLPRLAGRNYSILLAGSILICVFYKVMETGTLGLFLLNFERIYERREIAAQHLEQGLWAYVFSWGSKICAIYLIVVGWERRNWGFMLVGTVFAVLIFGVLAHKAILLSVMVVAVIIFFFPLAENRLSLVPLGLSIMLIILAVLASCFDSYRYQDILARRLFFTPAKLDFLYYDFFKDHAPLYFSNGFLRSFIEYPFDRQYTLVMGEFAGMGGEGTAANNGFLATGFMQLGWIGVVLYPMVAGGLAATVDMFSKGRNPSVVAALCFYPFAALFTSSDLPTAFLTHGIGLLLILLWLDRAQSNENER